jgi:hypothetical protein
MAIDQFFPDILLSIERHLRFDRESNTFAECLRLAGFGQQTTHSLQFSSSGPKSGLYKISDVFKDKEGINGFQ